MKLIIKPFKSETTKLNKYELTVSYEMDTGTNIEDEIYLDTEEEAIEVIKSLRVDIENWSTVENTENESIKSSIEYVLLEMGVCNEVRFNSVFVRWINRMGLKQEVEIAE